MGRAVTSISHRLETLARSFDRAQKLPIGAVLNAREMASLLDVSAPILRGWVNKFDDVAQSGAFERGSEGRDYNFCPIRTILALIRHFEASRDKQARRTSAVTRDAGVTMPEDEEAASFDETKGLVRLTLDIVDARERVSHYTPAAQMAQFVDGYNQTVVNGIMGVTTRIDPNGKLPAQVRALMDEELRHLAVQVHGEALTYTEKQIAGVQQEGTG